MCCHSNSSRCEGSALSFGLPKLTCSLMRSACRGITNVSDNGERLASTFGMYARGWEPWMREIVDKVKGGARKSGILDLQMSRIERWIGYRPPCRIELTGSRIGEYICSQKRTTSFVRWANFRSVQFIVYQKLGTIRGDSILTTETKKLDSTIGQSDQRWVSNGRQNTHWMRQNPSKSQSLPTVPTALATSDVWFHRPSPG